MYYIFVVVILNICMYVIYNKFDLFFFFFIDSYIDERIKLNVNYDERYGVRIVLVLVLKINGD